MEQNKKLEHENKKDTKNVLEQYSAQTENNEDIHFYHSDWTYTDSSCCC